MYGVDPQLLRLRKLVLETVGHSVRIASSGDQVRRIIETSQIDLLLLCHTLPTEECNNLIKVAQDAWPWIKVLVLVGTRTGCRGSDLDEEFDANEGPEKLLSKIDDLVDPMVH